MSTENGCPLVCDVCGEVMAYLDYEEFVHFEEGDGKAGTCFSCSPFSSSQSPLVLTGLKVGEVLHYEDQEFWVNRNVNGQLRLRSSRSHAHASAHGTCLSSYTYLNTSPNQGGEREETDVNDAKCPVCGENAGEVWYDGIRCTNCGWHEGWKEEIILPSRIVDFDGVLVAKNDADLHCTDCLTVQSSGRGSYCAYHHALLIEQYEDGSLEQGHA